MLLSKKKRIVSSRPFAPWINIFVKAQKLVKRQAERLYRKTGLTIHKDIFKFQKNKTVNMIKEEKRKYILRKIASSNSSKELFKTFNDLIDKKKNNSLPVDVPKNELPNTFNIFFTDKIEKIRNKPHQIPTQTFFKKYRGLTLSSFAPVTKEYVRRIISNCKKSFSDFDRLPAKLFYECLDVLLPYITKIYNDSLESGTFPSHFKDSLVIPLLKRPSLDCKNLKNYRPVSNLSFISKVLERIVYSQFLNHITANKLIDKFQSAYKPGHSTETALVRVVNNMLNAIDNGNLSLLTLLETSRPLLTLSIILSYSSVYKHLLASTDFPLNG